MIQPGSSAAHSGLPRGTARTAEARAGLDRTGSGSARGSGSQLGGRLGSRLGELLLVLLLPYALGIVMLVGGLAIVLPIKLVMSIVVWWSRGL